MIQQKIIYLVDDDEEDRFLISQVLQAAIENLVIIEFTNGTAFLLQFFQENYQLENALVLIDVNMPGINGLDVIYALRSRLFEKLLPVLAISTATSPQLVEELSQAGATSYFTKPDNLKGLQKLAEDIKKYFVS